jgi:mercuric ion binding protein
MTTMKKLACMIVSLLLTTTLVSAQQADKTAQKPTIAEVKIKTSAVCDMCKTTLEKAMAYERGVKESSLDVDSKILTVKYNPQKTTPEKIKKAVTTAGYDADEMPADPKSYDNLNACCKKDAKH